jgi:hypothetical protein
MKRIIFIICMLFPAVVVAAGGPAVITIVKPPPTAIVVNSINPPSVTISTPGPAVTQIVVPGPPGPPGVTDHALLANVGTTTHGQIDTALTRLANTTGTNTGDQDLSNLVPKTTTVNGKALSGNVTLSASDVGAVAAPYSPVFFVSNTDRTLTGTINETELVSITIPGGTLGPNGVLRITTLWAMTGTANAKTIRIKFGGTAFHTATTSGVAYSYAQLQTIIRNRNNTAAQISNSGAQSVAAWASYSYGYGGGGNITASIDTTQTQVISITGQHTSAAETIYLQSVIVEVLK